MKENIKITDDFLSYIGFITEADGWLSLSMGCEFETRGIAMKSVDGGYICYLEGFDDRVEINRITFIHELLGIAKVIRGCDELISEIEHYLNMVIL